MERLWVVVLDTVRLRLRLRHAAARCALRALEPAARAAGIRLVDACVIPCGMRAIVAARDVRGVRAFVRRFVALSSVSSAAAPIAWRAATRLATISKSALLAWRAYIARCRHVFTEEAMMDTQSRPVEASSAITSAGLHSRERGKRGGLTKTMVRAGVRCVHAIDAVVDAMLGADECTARLHRYVADHDSPADDRVAFSRLCEVIFTQGIGIAVVIGKRDGLRAAFSGFDPESVSRFDEDDVRRLLVSPIIRNEAKIRACIENAKRWQAVASAEGTYLARVARIGAGDNAADGWVGLVAALVADFVRIGEPAARQTLKRWGFFTAAPHPGSRRVVERLGFIDDGAPPAAVQLAVGAIAHALGRDPYAVEATLSLFAALGPCKPMPQCPRCALAERCPTGVRSSTPAA